MIYIHDHASQLSSHVSPPIVSHPRVLASSRPRQLCTVLCTLGHFYATQRAVQEYLIDGGIDSNDAARLIGASYLTFATRSSHADGETFGRCVEENTPGGMNHMVVEEMARCGGYEQLKAALAKVSDRLEGRAAAGSDAGLPLEGGPGTIASDC